MGAQESVDLACVEGDAGALRDRRAGISHALDRSAAAQLAHELTGAVDSCLCICGMQAFFKDTGRIRAQADALGGFADVGAVEGRGLKEDRLHFVGDLGILTAHDAGDADFLLCVADHENIVVHFAHLSVQGLEHIAVLCAADNDLVSGDSVEVKCVHGLAVLDHDIVGDVDQVVDGTDAAGGKTSLHPVGGRADLDIGADACSVTAAQVGVFDLDGDIVIDISGLVLCGGHIGFHKAGAEGNGRFTGNTEQAVAVHAVGSDLIFENSVAQAQKLHSVHAGFYGVHGAGFFAVKLTGLCQLAGLLLGDGAKGLGEDIDALFGRLGIGVAVGAQLFDGAHHTGRRNAAELAGLDLDSVLGKGAAVMSAGNTSAVEDDGDQGAFEHVVGAGDDLHSLCANINLADDQLVCVGMLLDGQDSAHYDFFQVLVQTRNAVNLGSGHCHPVIIFLVGACELRHICFQP